MTTIKTRFVLSTLPSPHLIFSLVEDLLLKDDESLNWSDWNLPRCYRGGSTKNLSPVFKNRSFLKLEKVKKANCRFTIDTPYFLTSLTICPSNLYF